MNWQKYNYSQVHYFCNYMLWQSKMTTGPTIWIISIKAHKILIIRLSSNSFNNPPPKFTSSTTSLLSYQLCWEKKKYLNLYMDSINLKLENFVLVTKFYMGWSWILNFYFMLVTSHKSINMTIWKIHHRITILSIAN